MDFIRQTGIKKIHAYENSLCERFISRLGDTEHIRIYRGRTGTYLPIVLFNADDLTSEQTAELLSKSGFALRGGLHCSPLAHRTVGTFPAGGVRFAPSCFNTAAQTDALAERLKRIYQ